MLWLICVEHTILPFCLLFLRAYSIRILSKIIFHFWLVVRCQLRELTIKSRLCSAIFLHYYISNSCTSYMKVFGRLIAELLWMNRLLILLKNIMKDKKSFILEYFCFDGDKFILIIKSRFINSFIFHKSLCHIHSDMH